MTSSLDELFRKFLSETRSSDDERVNRIYSILQRDRFGVDCFDGEIQIQLESGDYGEFPQSIWQSFKEQNLQGSPEA